ncbi:hypothetical protein [Aquimarina rhabdastrellae]
MKHFFFRILCCMMISYIGTAQNILKITEEDQDQQYQTATGAIEASYINSKIVDINSTLALEIDYETLLLHIGKTSNIGLPEAYTTKLNLLIDAMKTRNKHLEQFKNLLHQYDYESFKADPEKNRAWASQMQTLAYNVIDLTTIDPYIESGPGGFRPKDIYERTAVVLDRMKENVAKHAQQEGVAIQMGAWLVTKNQQIALHLPEFDEIKPQTSYEVQRWQLLPTIDQLNQLNQLQQFAKENTDTGIAILKKTLDAEVDRLKGVFTADFNMQLATIKNALAAFDTAEVQPLVTKLKTIETYCDQLKNQINSRISYYKGLQEQDIANPLGIISNVNADITFLKDGLGKQIKDDFETVKADITSLTTSLQSTEGKQLVASVNSAIAHYSQWYNTLKNLVNPNTISTLLGGTTVDFKTLDFSEEVLSFSLQELPKRTRLDLVTTGRRKDGDQIAFKFEVKTTKDMIYHEYRKVMMYRILPHIEGTVGVVFADPLAHTAIKTQFQMAPYYNLILKGGFDQKLRRKSVLYNQLFDFGIGLHVSAPDFDGDDIPELGTGMVISMLHDYVQSGMAINVFTGDPYWFFGIRIPVPSFNIGNLGR